MGKGSTRSTRKKEEVWKPVFLAELLNAPNVAEACRIAGIDRTTAYNHKHADQDFSAAWDSAIELSMDKAEAELYRRAVEGVEKPVYQGGELVGHLQEYSDTLLIFMLKSRRRPIYGERLAIEIDYSNMSDEQLRRLAAGEDPKRVLSSSGSGVG